MGIEGKTPTREEFAALLVLSAGVMISVWEGLHGSVVGIVFACCGELEVGCFGVCLGLVERAKSLCKHTRNTC